MRIVIPHMSEVASQVMERVSHVRHDAAEVIQRAEVDLPRSRQVSDHVFDMMVQSIQLSDISPQVTDAAAVMCHFVDMASKAFHFRDIAIQVNIITRGTEVSMNFRVHLGRLTLQTKGQVVDMGMALSLCGAREAEESGADGHRQEGRFE